MTFAFNRIDSLVRFSYQHHTFESDIFALGFSLTNKDGNVMTLYHYIYVTLWSPSKKYMFFRSFCTWAVHRCFIGTIVRHMYPNSRDLWVINRHVTSVFCAYTILFKWEDIYIISSMMLCLRTFWEQTNFVRMSTTSHQKFKPAWKASWSLASSDPIDF